MSITTLESNTVSNGIKACNLVLQQLKPLLDSLDAIYNAAGGVKETLTQDDLDGVTSFSNLTKAQVDDAMYALTSSIKGAIDSAYSQLAELAARG